MRARVAVWKFPCAEASAQVTALMIIMSTAMMSTNISRAPTMLLNSSAAPIAV